jgi:hypothetical protein
VSQFIVLANGNVGLGTETPTSKLHIIGDTRYEGQVILENPCFFRGAPSYGFRFNDHDSNYNNFIIYESGNTYTRGKVGVAINQPSYQFHLAAAYSGWATCMYSTYSTNLMTHNSGYGFYCGVSRNNSSYYIADFRRNITVQNDGAPLGGISALYIRADGNIGINTDSPSYALHVSGTIYATGAITALSDARKKDITGEAEVSVEQIAHAPAVQFLWKDKERRKDGQQVGTLAQYWQTVLPEVVSDKGGELSMQYGVAALVSSIIIARKVANHEVRIDKMEKWMKKWAEENDE